MLPVTFEQSEPMFTFNFIGLIFFPIAVITVMLPIRYDIKTTSPHLNYQRLIFYCFLGITGFNVLFSIINYLSYGQEAQTNLFYNYGSDKPFMFYIQMIFLIPTVVLDLIIFYPSFRIIYSHIFPRGEENYILMLIVKIGFIGFGTVICFLGTGLINYISFVSSFFIAFIGTVVPFTYYTLYSWKTLVFRKKLALLHLILLSIGIWLTCSYVSLEDLLNQKNISHVIKKYSQ